MTTIRARWARSLVAARHPFRTAGARRAPRTHVDRPHEAVRPAPMPTGTASFRQYIL